MQVCATRRQVIHMKQRRVYRADDIAQATQAVIALRAQGISDDISLVARSDIELRSIPNRHKKADTDIMPAAIRGQSSASII